MRTGFQVVYTLVSNQDDFDRYEGLQWHATENYRRTNSADADISQIADQIAKDKDAYLRWGRETLGWAIYILRPSRPN
jgi:hypothetical protein